MKDLLVLFKALYKNANVRQVKADGKRKLSSRIVMLLLLIPVVLIFCGILAFLTVATVTDVKALATLIGSAVGISQIFALIMGLSYVVNTLYSGSDRALLNALPIRPSTVFMAKFALSYIGLLKICASLILPLSLTAAIAYSACGRPMFFAFFALIFGVTLISPILPLAVITLFSLPMSYIGSYLKGHSVLKSALYCVLYVGIFAIYVVAIVLMNSSASGADSETVDSAVAYSNMFAGLSMFNNIFYPTKVAVECALGINGWVNFGVTAGITIGLIALTVLLAALFFKRISQRSLESNEDKTAHKTSFKQSGLIASLVKKDFKSIIRNPQMTMTSFANLLMAPLFTVIMYFATFSQASAETSGNSAFLASFIGVMVAHMFACMYLGSANALSTLAFSREGKAYFLNRSLPISGEQQVAAKLILAFAASSVVNVINLILVIFLYKAGYNAILFYVCSEIYVLGCVALNIYADARYGNVNWSNRQELQQVGGSMNRLLVTLLCAVTPVIVFISGLVLGIVGMGMKMSKELIYVIYWVISFALSAIFMGIGLYLAIKRSSKYLDDFGERVFIARKRMNATGFKPPRGMLKK